MILKCLFRNTTVDQRKQNPNELNYSETRHLYVNYNKQVRSLVCFNKFVLLLLIFVFQYSLSFSTEPQNIEIPVFTKSTASKFAKQAISCINSQYPYRGFEILLDSSDLIAPSENHPTFYGCSNWSTSVQTHWMLVSLLKKFDQLPEKELIIQILNSNFDSKKISREIAYLNNPGRIDFERPYGWAWVLKLATELKNWDNSNAQKWYKAIIPLADQIKRNYYDYFPGLYYPVRKGSIDNSAFGLSFAFDYAVSIGDKTFETFIIERARFYFLNDRDIPASWEPEGQDLLSPSLIEADLMQKVLTNDEFIRWFKNYMPIIPFSLQYPVVVSNRNDPKGLNLDGLNLSRAWCLFSLAKIAPPESKLQEELWTSGFRHAADALPNIISNNLAGNNWLSTYTVYMYSVLGLK